MKFYIVLLAVMLRSLSEAKAEPLQLPVYSVGNLGLRSSAFPVSYRTSLVQRPFQRCFKNNILTNCPNSSQSLQFIRFVSKTVQNRVAEQRNVTSKISSSEKPAGYRRIHDADRAYISLKKPERLTSPLKSTPVKKLNLTLDKPYLKPIVKYFHGDGGFETSFKKEEDIKTPSKKGETVGTSASFENVQNVEISYENVKTVETTTEYVSSLNETVSGAEYYNPNNLGGQYNFNKSLIFALDQFENKLYAINFKKFTALTPASKGDSAMSFVQSGLFLEMALMALSTEVDVDTKTEIDQSFGLVDFGDLDKIKFIKQVISSLPNSSEDLKFRWSSRLMLRFGRQLSEEFSTGTAKALQLKIDHFRGNETTEEMAQVLNKMIEEDSGGAIRDTFEEDDLSGNEDAVLITTLYLRARWRSAPTLLNGTWPFRDTGNIPSRTVRMIRINDVMKYVDLPEWDAEAIKISYLTQGLSLLMLVPRGNSLKGLVGNVTSANLTSITERMQTIRIAATLPLYTLRMTLLLPNKLRDMGIPRLVNASEAKSGSLLLSQAVQRIMFWAEAGRNAYKDDGLEWDESPEMAIVVDRPYIFFVRWQNMTLMNGNFVL